MSKANEKMKMRWTCVTLMRRSVVVVAAALVWSCGEGTEGTKTGEDCAQSNLIAQCPAGTEADLSATARSTCATSASAEGGPDGLDGVSGAASGEQVCSGEGTCKVLCRVVMGYCEYGVRSLTRDELTCFSSSEATACGNGTCDAGENPQNCPRDCGGVCTVGASRCVDANTLESCNERGEWERLACGDAAMCEAAGERDASCTDISAACRTTCDCLISPGVVQAVRDDDGNDIIIESMEQCVRLICLDPQNDEFVECVSDAISGDECTSGAVADCLP